MLSGRQVDERYGEAWMPFGGNDNLKRGHHVASRLTFSGVELTDDTPGGSRSGIRSRTREEPARRDREGRLQVNGGCASTGRGTV